MRVPAQSGILESVPAVAPHLFFSVADETSDRELLAEGLQRLAVIADGRELVVGLGPSLIAKLRWLAATQAGLLFVAFGRSHQAFEAQIRRMAGLDDGVADAMFRLSRPVTGAYLWCLPVDQGKLDLRQLRL